ncbi:DUF6114 domain-containing protein [Streptomyces candidus]|uniref:Integral membrane protein n=1 Tax=Streptomyces candidus TaxID=67283 RepID=A0A7X0HJR8_9ACTN|nr:DUF6114 domain-containing protein [Streptomyces candidus]MBB6437644.1 hypothetical protein [Streptomyces candidus]GHH53510.1 hypothetical protein GCM10018773_55080 [Streptomyces candidus]
MSAETTVPSQGRDVHYWRLRFRAWRGVRPFWAGLLTLVGGVPIMYFPYNDVKMGALTITMATTAGAGSLIIGVLLVTLGLTMWFHSIVRIFAGVASILLALVSIPVSNLGGFLFGFLLSMVGGAMSIAWAPARTDAHPYAVAPGTEPGGYGGASSAPAAAPAADPAAVAPATGRTTALDLSKPEGTAADTHLPAPPPSRGTDTTDTSVDADGRRNSAG